MKFDHAWTLAGKPRGETPAPSPGKRPPVLPRPPACRALFRQGKRIFRTGRRQHLAFGEHAPGPGVPRLAAPPKRHNRRPSYPPPSHRARLGNMHWAALIAWCAPACLRGPDWAAPPQPARFCLLGGFRNWFGFLERRVAVELRCGAVTVGRTYPFPPLSSGGALLVWAMAPFPHPSHRTGLADLPSRSVNLLMIVANWCCTARRM